MEIDKEKTAELAKTIRILAAEGVERARSGHPGLPLGAADYAAVLWGYHLKFNPEQPQWPNRDRFVLSAGHGSMLLYTLLHLFGYKVSPEDLRNFRQLGSCTPGHPEFGVTPGVETTTGPLGQGFANGVGMALSGKLMQERFGEKLFNYRVFGIVSDGDLMEGISSEAASLAGHLKLGNLIYIYDDNGISIGGSTSICFTESVSERFKAYGWNVLEINGHNHEDAHSALEHAVADREQPSLICARTIIGYGSPNKAGTPSVHGSPLGAAELALLKDNLGWKYDRDFYVPDVVRELCSSLIERKKKEYAGWLERYGKWKEDAPEKYKLFLDQTEKRIPEALKGELLKELSNSEKLNPATRSISGSAIQVIASHLPGFIGGSADLEPSNKTLIKDSSDISPADFSGKNIRFGVREHAMGGIVNGLAYNGGWFPYCATFLVFSDYMRASIRLAALSKLQVFYIFTHDSFYVGEDGPTHQPVEHIASLRLIPNLYLFRPADGIETAMCYVKALNIKNAPSVFCLTRQKLPELARRDDFNPDLILKGGYMLLEKESFDIVIAATGSEVSLAVETARILESKGISASVVSLPCLELFLEQADEYRDSVLPPGVPRVSIEAGITAGWERVTGENGLSVGLDHFGASAPAGMLAEKFEFTPKRAANRIADWFNNLT